MSVDQLVIMDLIKKASKLNVGIPLSLDVGGSISRVSTVKRNGVEFIEENKTQKMN
jgi:hypothetical protein